MRHQSCASSVFSTQELPQIPLLLQVLYFSPVTFPFQPPQNNAVGRATECGPSLLTARKNSFLSLSLALTANQASFFRQLKFLPFHAEVLLLPFFILIH